MTAPHLDGAAFGERGHHAIHVKPASAKARQERWGSLALQRVNNRPIRIISGQTRPSQRIKTSAGFVVDTDIL
jgi:hypothetical protein